MADIDTSKFEEQLDKLTQTMTALARVMAENVGNTEKTNKSVASVNKSFFGLSGNSFKLTREIEDLNHSIEYASKNTRSDFNMMSVSFKKGLIGFDAFTQGIIQTKKQLDEDRKSTRLNSSHSQQSRMPSSA